MRSSSHAPGGSCNCRVTSWLRRSSALRQATSCSASQPYQTTSAILASTLAPASPTTAKTQSALEPFMTAWDRWRQAARSLFASTLGCSFKHLLVRHHSELFASSTCSQAVCVMLCESVHFSCKPRGLRKTSAAAMIALPLTAPLPWRHSVLYEPPWRSARRQEHCHSLCNRAVIASARRHHFFAPGGCPRLGQAAGPKMCDTLTPRHHKLLNVQIAIATMLSTQHVCLQSIYWVAFLRDI